MFITHKREKKREWLLSIAYRIFKMARFFLPPSKLFPMLLDLDWITARLAHEESFRFYQTAEHPLLKSSVEYILGKLKRGDVILDLGCGGGEIGQGLAIRGYDVLGVDHSARSIERARKNYSLPNLQFECVDAVEYLQKSARKFNVLLLSHVLEHLDDPADFLRRFTGHFEHFFIEVPDFEVSYMNIYRLTAKTSLVYTDSDHVTEFDREELLRTVEQGGLRVVDQDFRFGMLRLWCARA